MNFPEGVNYIIFYSLAIKKGIKVRSKYAGVSVYSGNGGYLYFAAQALINGRVIKKLFPFTALGERSAHFEYLRMIDGKTETRGQSIKLKLK